MYFIENRLRNSRQYRAKYKELLIEAAAVYKVSKSFSDIHTYKVNHRAGLEFIFPELCIKLYRNGRIIERRYQALVLPFSIVLFLRFW